ncbi:hypothetical protein PI126_g15658, partial [Phytophthora idaei]
MRYPLLSVKKQHEKRVSLFSDEYIKPGQMLCQYTGEVLSLRIPSSPTGTSAPIVSEGGVFDRCSDPFFSKFQTVYQVGDWLEFSSLLPLTKRQRLYIRSSYRVIADQALLNPDGNMVKYAVVTGTPGVGKSVFVYYVMWRLIKDKKRVL